MPLIENVSMEEVRTGDHADMGKRAMLIQITDPAYYPPIPARDFAVIAHFEFLDAEDSDIERYGEEFLISDAQAGQLVELLRRALKEDRNVTVHCHAGVCRSGAVVEVATMLGFTAVKRFRQPNLRVKHRMMRYLGWTYDADETSEMINPPMSFGGMWGVM